MYHCHIHFYLIGHRCREFEIIKAMPPLEHFTHEFWESDRPENVLSAKADVILVNVPDSEETETLQAVLSNKNSSAECILLAGRKQITAISENLSQVKDIWTLPMSDAEINFRFLRWQQTYKMSRDFWQTSHFFEATINNIPNLIWYKDKNGIHEKVNDSFCKTVNKTKQQVEGRTHAYIWDVEYDDPACIESERQVMASQKTCISEERIKTGNDERLLTTYKSPLYDLDGSVMGTVGVAIDVTQERLYEQELLQKNHTLETIFASTDCGMLCHSIDGSRIISVNKAALRILGYESQDELMATGFDMIAASVMDEDKEKLRTSIKNLKKEGDSTSVEYRVLHSDGEILHIMGNVKLAKGNGELFYQRFLLDCTTQKQQEKEERMEKEKRQMELVQALGIDYSLVCFFDLDTGMGNTLRVENCRNEVIESIFREEISLDQSIGRYIRDYVYDDDREMMLESFSQDRLRKELEEKRIYYVNYRTSFNGELKYYQMKAVHVGGWDKHQGVVIGLRSVDEEIRSEMEKKNMLQEALLQANKANAAKSTFLSNMSHDIRTPMNAIVGFTSLAISHIDCKKQVEEYLEKIKISGNHLLHLINDILDMSRIESGKIQLEEKPCSLLDVLYGLHNILQVDIHEKQLELYIDTANILDEDIYCDQLRLNQLLLNLLSNSVKYTNPGGSINLIITETPAATAGYANYEFRIKDTGIGMSKEFVSHIFEPFERERNSTISRIQGTGLGMAITKNIVDMMNGTIDVKSEQGTGTEIVVSFTFRLYAEGKKLQSIPELENGRSLIISENSSFCDSIACMLEQIGMRPERALSAEEAVQRTQQAVIRKDSYCTYIIDGEMSDMSSIDVTRKIRTLSAPDKPIIIMTSYDCSNIRDRAKDAGVDAFCSKLLFLPELRDCLYSVIHADTEKEKEIPEPEILHKGHILLVEDIELNQELAVALLNEAGFSVDVAENGQVAVDMFAKSTPGYYQLILMDIQMPVMNGYEATIAIRNLENAELSSIPIFAMSANAFEEDRQKALKCGMNGHITKPIDIKVLFDTLRQVCG